MSFHQQPTWTRPDSPRPGPSATGRSPELQPGAKLLTGAADPRVESRRIALGLGLLAVLSIVLLNFGIVTGARERLARERWAQIGATLDAKREELRDLLWQFEHQAGFVAGQPQITQWIHAMVAPVPDPAVPAALRDELSRASRTFGYRSLRVVDPSGAVVASSTGSLDALAPGERGLVLEALREGRARIEDIREAEAGQPSLMLAVPVPADAPVGVVLFQGNLEDALLPLLMSWPGYGAGAGAYLVKREGDQLAFVTSPPANLGFSAGDRVAMNQNFMIAASMAVEGVESNVVTVDARSRPLWAATRGLPDRNWGLVGHVDQATAMTGMRGTLFGLLAIDLAMLMIAIAGVWYWRRQYRSGLAQREVEVTRRHAGRIQAIFDTAFDAILTFDRAGRIVAVNRAGATLFGMDPAAMEGQPFGRFLQRDADAGSPGASLPTGIVLRAEAVRANGTLVPVEFSLGSAGEDDELLYTAIVRDVTERVEAEKRIQTFAEGLERGNARLEEVNAQLEEASRLKSEFLANTSHELRTPLNGMIGFLQLVLDGLCDSKEEERDFLNKALQCSRHLLGLINDVLDIAKIEAGRLNLEIAHVDVGQLFDEVYTVTHVQAAQKGVRLQFEAPDAGPGVRGDFGKIKQVLINLVGNSLKFTPSGTITVRALAHPEPGHYVFEVADTGIGIPLERQQAIFEKFIQGDGSTTRKYGGTGLGLAITRSLVELMGGIIGVHSDGEGKGTRMYFSLPAWRGETESIEDDATPVDQILGPAGGPVVLIVEDDALFRRYLTALLHEHGYRTVEARHAEAGWTLARRLRPSVVVTDYALTCPEGATLRTGWDLAERMTADALTRHIPLIFVTGFDAELREKLKGTTFARHPEHLVKPIDGNALVQKLEALVGRIQNRVIRVLMADDDPSVTAYVRKVLPVDRFHVEVANNGDQCLHALRTQPRGFDLLLLDLMMPEVSGYDVLREMTLTGLSASLPVLVLTNYPEPRNEEEKRLLEQGLVMEVLPKATVHDNPQLLPHVIDWQLQMLLERHPSAASPPGGEDGEPEARMAA